MKQRRSRTKAMKSRLSMLAVGIMLLVASSCLKRDSPLDLSESKISNPLVLKAKTWYEQNSVLPSSSDPDDKNLRDYKPQWKKYAISKNSDSLDVVTVPLVSKQSKAYLTEIGVLVDKEGKTMGMVKEYIENPFLKDTRMNIYSGSGRLFLTGIYRPSNKRITLLPITATGRVMKGGYYANQPIRLKDEDTDPGAIELPEVPVTAPPSDPFPPIIPIFPPDSTFPSNPGIPTNPGGGGGGSTPPPNPPAPPAIIKNQVSDPCLKPLVDKVINDGVEGKVSEIISMLDGYTNVTISVIDYDQMLTNSDGQPCGARANAGKAARTGSTFTVPIEISKPYFSEASKEAFTAILIHEIIHSYYLYGDIHSTVLEQHTEMAQKYVAPMTSYLQQVYPGISYTDAFALSLSGLSNTDYYRNTDSSGGFYMNDTGSTLSATDLESIAAQYRGGVGDRPGKGTFICN